MRFLTLAEVLDLHGRVMAQTGGLSGIRDLGSVEGAVGQPRQMFGGQELYPTLAEKVAALGYALIRNHPFVDGNKRVGHAAMETFLVLNGYELDAPVEEAERCILRVASGEVSRDELLDWLRGHMRPLR